MPIWFDATTTMLINPPVIGIPRVELSLIQNLLFNATPDLHFCLYHHTHERYFEVARHELAKYIARHESKDPDYGITVDLTTPADLAPENDIFSPGDVFFTDREKISNLEKIYEIRQRIGIKVILCIHDIIPIKFPHFIPAMLKYFIPYVDNMAGNADHILTVSHNTRMDVIDYLNERNLRVPPISLLHLGCELATSKNEAVETKTIHAEPYIALISTIDRRKNHVVICNAYRILFERGLTNLPQLLFVGRHDQADELLDSIKEDSLISSKVTFLTSVTDSELKNIYQNCLFTVYPSLYEGFGLPIAESLAFGKVCISSNSSSMPEVGGIFADYADPYNATEWANKIADYVENPKKLHRREKSIRLGYKAPKWSDTAEQTMRLANAVQDLPIHQEKNILSIYIPTFERIELRQLLNSIRDQFHEDVEVIVSDNSISGFSENICSEYKFVKYRRTNHNIGADQNIMRGFTSSETKYIWIIGDDDIILPNGIKMVLNAISEKSPDRLILNTPDATVDDFSGTAADLISSLDDKSLLIAATLITANVFRRKIIDYKVVFQHNDSCYLHMWASIPARTVVCIKEPIFQIGIGYPNHFDWVYKSFQEYLDGLTIFLNINRINVAECLSWNYWVARKNSHQVI
jgi:glycosyltransferase involved in cell wall biosynthesis